MLWYSICLTPALHTMSYREASWAEADTRCHHLLLSHQLLGFSGGFGLAKDHHVLADVAIEGGCI